MGVTSRSFYKDNKSTYQLWPQTRNKQVVDHI